MPRAFVMTLALVLAFTSAACKSTHQDAPPVPSTGDASGEEKIRFSTPAEETSSGGPGAGAYIAAPFENVLWWPWKIVGTGIKGAGDGVGSGFQKDRMPILGFIFSPLTLCAGLVTGMAEG